MKKSFIAGTVFAFIGIMIGVLLRDWSMATKICGYFGFGCLFLAGIFEGSFISGDRIRANYSTEMEDDRTQRRNISSSLFIVSIPSILTAILLYFIM